MKKVKNLVLETPYHNCYCSLSEDMVRFYWYIVREPLMEDARDSVYNMLIGDWRVSWNNG